MIMSEKQFILAMLRRFRDESAEKHLINFEPLIRVIGEPVENFSIRDSPFDVKFHVNITFERLPGFDDPDGYSQASYLLAYQAEGIRIYSTNGKQKQYDQDGIFRLMTKAAIPSDNILLQLKGYTRRADRITEVQVIGAQRNWRRESARYQQDIVELQEKIAAFVKTTTKIKRAQARQRLAALQAFVQAQQTIAALTGLT